MADPIAHALLTDLDTRREAFQLALGIDEFVNGGCLRDEHAILIALVGCFMAACEQTEVDPFDTLAQIGDLLDSGEIDLDDDVAQGRFVFPAADEVQ